MLLFWALGRVFEWSIVDSGTSGSRADLILSSSIYCLLFGNIVEGRRVCFLRSSYRSSLEDLLQLGDFGCECLKSLPTTPTGINVGETEIVQDGGADGKAVL